MAQLIVFMSKAPVGQRSDKVYVSYYDTVAELHHDIQETITEVKEDYPVPDLATFTQMLENLPVNLSTPGDTPNVTIEVILRFENVPVGRNVVEVVSAIYYACSQTGLVDGLEIKRGRHMMAVLTSPEEVLNPKTFDWNIPKLISSYRNVLLLTSFLDFHEDGTVASDSVYPAPEEKKEETVTEIVRKAVSEAITEVVA